VSIQANGHYVIERGREENKAVNLEYVQKYVAKILKQQPDTDVLVRGDETVAYGKVIALMSTLQAAGAQGVGLVTEAPEPGR
jgi:biopolymer transport protein TolR